MKQHLGKMARLLTLRNVATGSFFKFVCLGFGTHATLLLDVLIYCYNFYWDTGTQRLSAFLILGKI